MQDVEDGLLIGSMEGLHKKKKTETAPRMVRPSGETAAEAGHSHLIVSSEGRDAAELGQAKGVHTATSRKLIAA